MNILSFFWFLFKISNYFLFWIVATDKVDGWTGGKSEGEVRELGESEKDGGSGLSDRRQNPQRKTPTRWTEVGQSHAG